MSKGCQGTHRNARAWFWSRCHIATLISAPGCECGIVLATRPGALGSMATESKAARMTEESVGQTLQCPINIRGLCSRARNETRIRQSKHTRTHSGGLLSSLHFRSVADIPGTERQEELHCQHRDTVSFFFFFFPWEGEDTPPPCQCVRKR